MQFFAAYFKDILLCFHVHSRRIAHSEFYKIIASKLQTISLFEILIQKRYSITHTLAIKSMTYFLVSNNSIYRLKDFSIQKHVLALVLIKTHVTSIRVSMWQLPLPGIIQSIITDPHFMWRVINTHEFGNSFCKQGTWILLLYHSFHRLWPSRHHLQCST